MTPQTEVKPQHTPTPWHVNGQDIFGELDTIARMVYSAIPENEQTENAAFIVRAVNCHEELIELLKHVLDTGRIAQELSVMPKIEIQFLDRIQQAIAKAEGR